MVTLNSYTVLESSNTFVRRAEDVFVVKDNVNIQSFLELYRPVVVKLIICDGATLTIGGDVSAGTAISIYSGNSESATIQGTGKIVSNGFRIPNDHTLNIYGGVIKSTFNNALHPGIGGYDGEGCGTVNIYGGTVTAIGGSTGAGIGGAHNGNGGTVNISGGTVTATAGGIISEGIGHGEFGTDSGTLTIASGMLLTGSNDGTNWSAISPSTRMKYMKVTPPLATVSTAPVASTGLAANGSAHALLTSGGASSTGTMQYALWTNSTTAPTSGWNTTIPTGTTAGTYYVWYKAKGDGNHYLDSSPVCLTVTILATATVSAAPVISTGLVANGSAHDLLTNGGTATNGTMQYALGDDATTAPTTGWSTTIPTGTNVGDYYVWYKAAGNGTQYTDSTPLCLTVTISGVASVTTIPTVSNGLKANGSAHNLLTNKGVAANGTMQFALGVNDTDAPTSGWSEDIPQGTETKTYHVWYKAAGTGVYTDSAPVCLQVVISPADTTPVNPVTPPYTPPYTQPYTPPYTPSNPQPILPGGGSWSTISTVVETVPAGGSLNINMNGSITLPTTATDSIKGKDINLVLDMGNGIKWSINGKDIAGASGDVYLGVYLDASGIPVDVVNRLTGEREKMNFMLSRDGGLGFAATLTLPLKKTWAGHIANLFNYNKITKDMDFVSSGKIGADGSADLVIGSTKTPAKTAALKKQSIAETLKLAATDETNQASSYYTIVVDDHSLDPNTTPEPTPTAEPTTTPATSAAITLSASSKDSKINLSWNKLKKAKKYRVYQKVDGKNKLFKELKKTSLTIDKAYVNGKKKRKKLKIGKKYTFSIKAFVNGKWTKITKASTKTIKVKK